MYRVPYEDFVDDDGTFVWEGGIEYYFSSDMQGKHKMPGWPSGDISNSEIESGEAEKKIQRAWERWCNAHAHLFPAI